MLRIGLTGGVASGKSTVARLFEALGVTVVDSDQLAREVVAPGTPGLEAVVQRFGPGILNDAGELDRAALRRLVFADPQARRDLEAITHPLIRAGMERRAVASGGPYLILMIPLLVEGGKLDRVDRILVVDCPEALQIRRVMVRDGITEDAARAMLAAQASREQRLAVAHDVVENTGDVAGLRDQVERLHGQYLRQAAAAGRS